MTGVPQCGHVRAWSLTCPLHSWHWMRAICYLAGGGGQGLGGSTCPGIFRRPGFSGRGIGGCGGLGAGGGCGGLGAGGL